MVVHGGPLATAGFWTDINDDVIVYSPPRSFPLWGERNIKEKEGREEGRKGGREEGRKGGREEGRKEGRK